MSTEKRIKVLEAECARMHAQLLAAQGAMEAMREAMGKEWSEDEGEQGTWEYCMECHWMKEFGHRESCRRGRFFALTPATGSAWAEAMDAVEKALTAMLEWVAFNFPKGEQPGKSEPVPAEYMRTALAALRRARGGGE